MRIGKPKVKRLDTGSAREGVFGNGRGAQRAGQIQSGHYHLSTPAGGSVPNLGGPGSSGRPVQKKKTKRLY